MHDPIYTLHYFKSLNCSFVILNNNNNDNNTNNNKMEFKTLNWISVNLGPVTFNIITKRKKEKSVPTGAKLTTSCIKTHAKYYFTLLLSDIPCCIIGHSLEANLHVFHWVKQGGFQTLFENNYSLAFKLVLQKIFHVLSYSV